MYSFPTKIFRNPEIEDKYQIVKVGNSHSMDGIKFEGYRLKSLSLAHAAQKFEIDHAFLRQHANEIEKNAVILIPVTPISFSHTDINASKGLQAEYYGRISPFYIPHLNIGDYIESQFLPFVRVGYFARQKYKSSIKNKKEDLPSTIESHIESNEIHADTVKYLDSNIIENELEKPSMYSSPTHDYIDNVHFTYHKWLETEEFSPDYFAKNRKDLEKLILFCLQQKWKPILITIPISKDLEDALPDDYLQKYLYENLAKTNKQNVEYIDLTTVRNFQTHTDYFSNSDHLSPKGSYVFSYLLLKVLIEKDYLSPSVNQYQ